MTSQDLCHHGIIKTFKIILQEKIKFEKDELKDILDLNFKYNAETPEVIESKVFPTEHNFQRLCTILMKAYGKKHQYNNASANSSRNFQENDSISYLNDSLQVKMDSNITGNKAFQNYTAVENERNEQHHEFEDGDEDVMTYYPMQKNIFDAARSYFSETEYSYFFKDAIDHELKFTPKDVKGKELLVKLKNLKVVPIEDENVDVVTSLVSNYTKIIRHKEKLLLVGPTDEVMSIQKKVKSNKEEAVPFSDHKINQVFSTTKGRMLGGEAAAKEPNVNRVMEGSYQQDENYERRLGSRYIRNLDEYSPIYIGCTGVEISVFNADITRLEVDCIVNAANKHLRHGGGVARVISKAAGYRLQDECERYIAEYKSVPVTGVFVSTGGDLPAKHVIHAVGPRWDDYDYSDKKKCTDDLRKTVLTCLLEATKREMSTIALPSISAAIFKVPTDLCAEAYMHAVKSYDAIVQKMKLTALKEIQFVDINDAMVLTIHEHFRNHWYKEIMFKFYDEDLKFAEFYMRKQSQATRFSRDNLPKHDYRGKQDDDTASSQVDKIVKPKHKDEESKYASSSKHSAETIKEFSFEVFQVKLTASAKHAFDFKPDLVIVVGETFDKLGGNSGFKATDLNVIDTGNQIKNVKTFISTKKDKKPIHVFQLSADEFNENKLKKSFQNLDPAIRLIKHKVTSLVITSNFLYPEKHQKVPDSKSVGKFAQLVYDFAKSTSIRFVTLTASEDAFPNILKVFQSREKELTAPGAYPHKQRNLTQLKPSKEEPQQLSKKNVTPSKPNSAKQKQPGKTHWK